MLLLVIGKEDFRTMENILDIFKDITPENFQEKLLDIQENYKALISEKEELEKTIGTQNETIGTLRDTNQRLFLRVSTDVSTQNEPEEPKDLTLDDIINNI